MKFIHLADCHIGGWREAVLAELSIKGLGEVVNVALTEKVGFVLISGDLFDTALPGIEIINKVAEELKRLKEEDIPVYIIPGSHDFSPSGKTMLDLLERTGLVDNVMKFNEGRLSFTEDRTGVKIVGVLGRKGGLEIEDYKKLEKDHLENEEGFKIFMFHTLLRELRPSGWEMVEGGDLSLLPKSFNYYAGGHPHFVYNKLHEEYGLITYPGPLFPNNFKELEDLKYGGFYLVDVRDGDINLEHKPLIFHEVVSLRVDVGGLTSEEAEEKILEKTIGDFNNKIVTLRVFGMLEKGKPGDINFRRIMKQFSSSFIALKNTVKLTTKEFEDFDVETGDVSDVEERIINSYLDQLKSFEMDSRKVEELMEVLSVEKLDGETNADFEARISKDVVSLLDLHGVWNAA
tara:strand:- start:483 stop:1691 length:1209 start_codon:yes stop_codon:yes gene_type:complete